MSKLKEPPPVSIQAKVAAASFAGLFGTLMIYPLDMLKTTMQVYHHNPATSGQSKLQGVFAHVKKLGFYHGIAPALIGIIPEKAIKLTLNDTIREGLARRQNVPEKELSVLAGVLAGGLAGFAQCVITNPMEIVKINMQTSDANLASTVKSLGLRGLYKGSSITLMRDVPFSVLFFPSYAYLRQHYFSNDLISGAIAGGLAASIVTPIDVVKTRLQSAFSNATNAGAIEITKSIIREDGASALFRGVVPRALIVAQLFGITLAVYELQKKWIARNTT